MARKTPSRLELRKQAEAAEKNPAAAKKATKKATKKKATRKKATRTKRAKTIERKKLVWGVFSGSLKEEARFPYDKRDEAEAKLEQMLAKGKKLYFIQPIKEIITETVTDDEAPVVAEEPVVVEPVVEAEVDEADEAEPDDAETDDAETDDDAEEEAEEPNDDDDDDE